MINIINHDQYHDFLCMIIQRKICLVLLLPSQPSSAQPAPLVLYLRFPSCFHELDHDCCIFTLITMITKIQDGNFFQSGSFCQIHNKLMSITHYRHYIRSSSLTMYITISIKILILFYSQGTIIFHCQVWKFFSWNCTFPSDRCA